MDILDDKRIEAITPRFEYYGLQDVIYLVEEELLEIRKNQFMTDTLGGYIYKINNWKIIFGNTFKDVCYDTKLIIINKIKEKYLLIDQILEKGTRKLATILNDKDNYLNNFYTSTNTNFTQIKDQNTKDKMLYFDYTSEKYSFKILLNNYKIENDKLEFNIRISNDLYNGYWPYYKMFTVYPSPEYGDDTIYPEQYSISWNM